MLDAGKKQVVAAEALERRCGSGGPFVGIDSFIDITNAMWQGWRGFGGVEVDVGQDVFRVNALHGQLQPELLQGHLHLQESDQPCHVPVSCDGRVWGNTELGRGISMGIGLGEVWNGSRRGET